MTADFNSFTRSDHYAFRRSPHGARGGVDLELPYYYYTVFGAAPFERDDADYWIGQAVKGVVLGLGASNFDIWPGRGTFHNANGDVNHTDYFGTTLWTESIGIDGVIDLALCGPTTNAFVVWIRQIEAESVIGRNVALTGGSTATIDCEFLGSKYWPIEVAGNFTSSINAWILARRDLSEEDDTSPTLGDWYVLKVTASPLAVVSATKIADAAETPAPVSLKLAGEGGTLYLARGGTRFDAYDLALERVTAKDFVDTGTYQTRDAGYVIHGDDLFAEVLNPVAMMKFDRAGALVIQTSLLGEQGGAWAAQRVALPITIESRTPITANKDGGDTITINGSGFVDGMKVYIDDALTQGTDVTVLSSTQATFTAPAHAVGDVALIVNVGDGYDIYRDAIEYIELVNAPVVTITAPTVLIWTTADSIAFAGTATDVEDGDLTSSLSWSSSIDGVIGSGGSFSTTLSAGIHLITASVTDSDSNPGSDSISLVVI